MHVTNHNGKNHPQILYHIESKSMFSRRLKLFIMILNVKQEDYILTSLFQCEIWDPGFKRTNIYIETSRLHIWWTICNNEFHFSRTAKGCAMQHATILCNPDWPQDLQGALHIQKNSEGFQICSKRLAFARCGGFSTQQDWIFNKKPSNIRITQ